jgi:hypothetical protein
MFRLLGFWLCASVVAFAQTPPPYQPLRFDEDWSYLKDAAKRTEPLDKLKYIPLGNREGWYISLGGEARARYEYFNQANFGAGAQDANGYAMQRYLLHADWHFGQHVRVFTQLQSGLLNGRNGGPRPTDRDDLDLHQAFIDLKFGNREKGEVTIRAGRNEVELGAGRMISSAEGLNVRRSFDGVRVIYQRGNWWANLMSGKLVAAKPGTFDAVPINDQTYWGAAFARLFPQHKGGIAVYQLGGDRKTARFNQGTGRELRHTLGSRVWWTRGQFDHNYEFIGQWGSFGERTGATQIRAWAVATDTGYSLPHLKLKPRFGLRADAASGDSQIGDRKLGTFNPYFPSIAWSDTASLFGPLNMRELAWSARLLPHPRVTVSGDTGFYWRQNTNDGLYSPGIILIRPSHPSRAAHTGNLIRGRLEWRIHRHLTYSATYARFFSGRFLRETPPGKSVHYLTSWMTFRF